MKDAIRQIREGIVGRSYVLKAQRHSGRSRPVPGQPQRIRLPWYNAVKRSGDLIVENAVHNLDACNWIANSHPVSAYGRGGRYFPEPIPAGSAMMDGFTPMSLPPYRLRISIAVAAQCHRTGVTDEWNGDLLAKAGWPRAWRHIEGLTRQPPRPVRKGGVGA